MAATSTKATSQRQENRSSSVSWSDSIRESEDRCSSSLGIPYDLEYLDETYTRSSRLVRVGDLVDRGARRFAYEYDFGDGWAHTVEIEKVHAYDTGSCPRCLDGARACPPEDCGGVDGYARLLEILFDPRHEEFEEMCQWVGPDFAPDRFDLGEVNARLSRVGW